MIQNPNMGAADRVAWRRVIQAATEAGGGPAVVAKAKVLKQALSAAKERQMPDLRPMPAACFRAFLVMAQGFLKEADDKVRAELAPRLIALADAAGDILDGLQADETPPPAWTQRADLR